MKALREIIGRAQGPVRNEDGAVLVFFGLFVIALFALFAVAVDVGARLNARSEAQRAADAGALAGAGLFMNGSRTPEQSRALAPDTAYDFAYMNLVGGSTADSIAVSFPNFPTEWRVRVQVWGKTTALFSRLIGFDVLPVYAEAEARVMGSANATCVKPFAVPDMWHSNYASSPVYNPADADDWTWDNNDDNTYYTPWNGAAGDNQSTGFGSSRRDGHSNWLGNTYTQDRGRRFIVKRGNQGIQDPASAEAPVHLVPSDFYGVVLEGPTTAIAGVNQQGNKCQGRTGTGGQTGGNVYRDNICSCYTQPIAIGDVLQTEPGAMIGPTSEGIERLLQAGPPVQWVNTNGGRVEDMQGNVVNDHPRMMNVLLYNPAEAQQGRSELTVSNIALVYLDGIDSGGNVVGRFMMYAPGQGAGAGTTVRSLQLVK